MTREQIEGDRRNVEQMFAPVVRSKDLDLLSHSINYVSGLITDYEQEKKDIPVRIALKYFKFARDQFQKRIKKIQRANDVKNARLTIDRENRKRINALLDLHIAERLKYAHIKTEHEARVIQHDLKQLLTAGYDPLELPEDRERAINAIMSRPDEQALETVKALEEYDRLKREASAEANPEDFMRALESEEPKHDA